MKAPIVGWAALSALLFETASRDLTGIGGAFSLSSGEWTIITFAAGVIFASVAAWRAHRNV